MLALLVEGGRVLQRHYAYQSLRIPSQEPVTALSSPNQVAASQSDLLGQLSHLHSAFITHNPNIPNLITG